MFLNSKDLLRIRDLAMIILSFSGFLRFNELSQLRGNDVIVKDCYLIIKIRKSKHTAKLTEQ
jgi:integrase